VPLGFNRERGVVVWEFILFYPLGDVTFVYFKGQTFELSIKGFFTFVLFFHKYFLKEEDFFLQRKRKEEEFGINKRRRRHPSFNLGALRGKNGTKRKA
jgi:hypothetical protein